MGVPQGEQKMWHDIASMARSLAKMADAIQKVVDEEFSEPEPEKDTLTKTAWRSEVSKHNTELGYAEWLGRHRDG